MGEDVTIREIGRPGDLGWIVMAHGRLYAEEFGWDASFESLVARIVADFAAEADQTRERGWIAELDGAPVGCVLCVRHSDDCAQLRILLVEPAGRGRRVGARLVDACVEFARSAGYRRIRLWTNHPLTAAHRVYRAAGFRLVSSEPHHSFGQDLVGEVHELDLAATISAEGAAKPATG